MTARLLTASRRGVIALAGLTVAACSPLRMFNALMPKDGGGEAIAHGLPFGPDARQRLDIYGPGSRAFQPLPVIVFFYGGSWSSGTRAGYAFLGRALASGGFIVVIPDYRLVPHVVYPAFLQDNAAAVHWVREHIAPFGGDPDRIILAGHSAGAYNAAMLALDPRWLGEDRRAVKGLIGLAGPYDFLPFKGPVVESAFPHIARPELTQPVHYAQAGSPPAFLASGDRDHVVLPANSDALALALRQRGAFVERKRYPDVGHVGLVTAIARPLRGKAPVLADMMAFAHKVTS